MNTRTESTYNGHKKANKTNAGNGSYGICRVIDASRSPAPDPKRSARTHRLKLQMTKPSKDFLMRKAERLKRAITRHPTSAILHQGLGRTYSDLKSFKEARHCFVKSLKLDPSDLWTNLYLGNSYYREEDYPSALDYFNNAHSLNSKVAMPLVCLADTFHKLGEDEKADGLYNKAVQTDPECEVARRNLERWQAHYRPEENAESSRGGRIAPPTPPTPPGMRV